MFSSKDNLRIFTVKFNLSNDFQILVNFCSTVLYTVFNGKRRVFHDMEGSNKMASKKNENRKTTVKGVLANPQTQKFQEFEETISYTRSTVKAAKAIREMMGLESHVMVSIFELIQEDVKKPVYNSQLITEFMICDAPSRDEVEAIVRENQTIIKYGMYYYSAQLWLDFGGDYRTEPILDNSPLKLSKVDARAFVKLCGENLYTGAKVIGIHNCDRELVERYAIINNDDLEKCIKEQ